MKNYVLASAQHKSEKFHWTRNEICAWRFHFSLLFWHERIEFFMFYAESCNFDYPKRSRIKLFSFWGTFWWGLCILSYEYFILIALQLSPSSYTCPVLLPIIDESTSFSSIFTQIFTVHLLTCYIRIDSSYNYAINLRFRWNFHLKFSESHSRLSFCSKSTITNEKLFPIFLPAREGFAFFDTCATFGSPSYDFESFRRRFWIDCNRHIACVWSWKEHTKMVFDGFLLNFWSFPCDVVTFVNNNATNLRDLNLHFTFYQFYLNLFNTTCNFLDK